MRSLAAIPVLLWLWVPGDSEAVDTLAFLSAHLLSVAEQTQTFGLPAKKVLKT